MPVASAGGQQATATTSSNAVLAAATRVKGAATALIAQAKPWSELADRSAFSKPSDLAEVRVGRGERGREKIMWRDRKKTVWKEAPTFFRKKKRQLAFSGLARPRSRSK